MDPDNPLHEVATQYRWAIANIAVAALCLFAGVYCFMNDYVVAGLLTLAISAAAVWNADVHKKRGDGYAREARG
jgi:hypothetical protein